MPDGLDRAWLALMDGLRPEPPISVSEWADRNRILPPTAPAPGPWKTSRTPYLKEVMDALSPSSRFEKVAVLAGSQLGKTETALNWLGFIIDNSPSLVMLVMPTVSMVKRNTSTRIDPLIADCPALARKVVKAGSRDPGNSQFRKRFIGGELVMTGANSAAELCSTPVCYLLLDEIDRYPGDVDDEGDPVDLAIARTSNFRGRRKILMVSTPGNAGESRIEAAYLESDQRVFEVPCSACGVFSELRWSNIDWPRADGAMPHDDETGVTAWPDPPRTERDRRDLAYWWCPSCGRRHDEHRKTELLAAGQWRATAIGDGKTAGFRMSQLVSPWVTWGEVAEKAASAGKDPSRLRVFVNTVLAETWEDRTGKRIEPSAIMDRVEKGDWRAMLPRGVVILTASVDVQDNRLEVEIVGWGRDEESWSIDYIQLFGDPSQQEVWQELDEVLKRTYRHTLAVMDLGISAVCLDTQGHNSAMAYTFCRDKSARRVWAIKGHNMQGKPIWPRRPSHKNKGRVPLYMVGSSAAKEVIYARLEITGPGPGFMHFPADRSDKYFSQLTAETCKKVRKKGRLTIVWDAGDRRNEALDLKVYNLAALYGLQALGFDLNAAAATMAQQPERVADRPVLTSAPAVRKATRSTWLSA